MRRSSLALLALCLGLVLVWGPGAALAGWKDKHPDNSPKVGEEAPDFELVTLKAFLAETDPEKKAEAEPKEGEKEGEAEEEPRTVKLSSFRGEKPVVFVLTSYT